MDARCLFSAVFRAGGTFSVRFAPRTPSIKFGVVLRGECWIGLDGLAPRKLAAGDSYLIVRNHPYRLASDPNIRPIESDGSLVAGAGDEVHVAGGRFVFAGAGAALLIDLLPPVLHVPAGTDTAGVLPWVLERLRIERETQQPGSGLVTEHLANIMFVQMLREQLTRKPDQTGWTRALADERIGSAIRIIHQEPSRKWTVNDLARAVGASRSSFALRFKKLVGIAPLEYILRWRVAIAEHALVYDDAKIAAIADSVGYDSETAFSTAFKRVNGATPAHFRTARIRVLSDQRTDHGISL